MIGHPTTIRTVAVLGAGNAGCAAAAHLTHQGFQVRLFSRTSDRLAPIADRGGIEIVGALGNHFIPLRSITPDLKEACGDANVIMLCVPTSAHDQYARDLADLIRPEQVLFLNPGHVGGSLSMAHLIYRATGRTDVRICEAATLTYGCRMREPTVVDVLSVPTGVPFAAFPGMYQAELFEHARQLYPELMMATSVLETALWCINSIVHPAQILCNAGWIESTGGRFHLYQEGTSASVARVIDRIDNERLEVAEALGIPMRPFAVCMYELGYTTEAAASTGRAHAVLQNNAASQTVMAPDSLDTRFLHEDLGRGLVPWTEIARAVGVSTPAMDALIALASLMTGIDYRSAGLRLEQLGLADRAPAEWQRYVYGGIQSVPS